MKTRMRELMVLGKKFGGTNLNIVDGRPCPTCAAAIKYDDEGVPATRTNLIREGD